MTEQRKFNFKFNNANTDMSMFDNSGLNKDHIKLLYNHINNYIFDMKFNNNILELYKKHLYNIISSSKLLQDKINNDEIDISELKDMTIDELFPEKWTPKEIKYEPVISTLYECTKCNGPCSYYNYQLRSADEGMSTKVTCANKLCGYSWWIK